MMMVRITTAGVTGVAFESRDETMADPTMLMWPFVQRELSRLDQRIKRESSKIAKRIATLE